jgi:hypothetical protein
LRSIVMSPTVLCMRAMMHDRGARGRDLALA